MTKMAGSLSGVSQAAVNDFKHACAISISVAFFILFIFIVWDPSFQEPSPGSSSLTVMDDLPVVVENQRISKPDPSSQEQSPDSSSTSVVDSDPAASNFTRIAERDGSFEESAPSSSFPTVVDNVTRIAETELDPGFQEIFPGSSPPADMDEVTKINAPDAIFRELSANSSSPSVLDEDVTRISELDSNIQEQELSSSSLSPTIVEDVSVAENQTRNTEPEWSQETNIDFVNVEKLVQDIREVAKLASGGDPTEMTQAEIDEWNRQNPCRSRSELLPMYDLRKNVQKLAPNVLLDNVLDEYSKLHRACTHKLGANLTEIFLKNMTVPGCNFVLGSPMYGTGLGNKMIVTISALVYAILTQRIILLPLRTHLPTFMCEPFVGSSWKLDTSAFPMPDGQNPVLPWEGEVAKSDEWADDSDFLKAMDAWIEERQSSQGSNVTEFSSLELPTVTYALSVTIRWQPADRFYCEAEQFMVAQVPWLYWGGCIYSVPKLFGSALYGATLKELFPDRMVMARLLRSSLLPSDEVFSQLLEVNNQYFSPGDRRVGIQLRNRQGEDYFERMKDELNRRILVCGVENGFLPNKSSSDSVERPTNPPKTKVFIASLYHGLYEYLNDSYRGVITTTGEEVELLQVSNREKQKLGAEEDIQALVEILVLSLSDQLLVTPASTFGSIAQGYGAMTPWFIETRENKDDTTYGACERAQSIDICHQYTDVSYDCPHSPQSDTKIELDKEPGFKRCMDIDHTAGIQLISTFQSDI